MHPSRASRNMPPAKPGEFLPRINAFSPFLAPMARRPLASLFVLSANRPQVISRFTTRRRPDLDKGRRPSGIRRACFAITSMMFIYRPLPHFRVGSSRLHAPSRCRKPVFARKRSFNSDYIIRIPKSPPIPCKSHIDYGGARIKIMLIRQIKTHPDKVLMRVSGAVKA